MHQKLIYLFGIWIFSVPIWSQTNYPTIPQIAQRLQKINANSDATLSSLVKTEGGNDIWVLKIGIGDLDNKPGIAVVGGTEGFHVLGVELALQFAERLVANHSKILETTTFYIFPNMSPDAYGQYHTSLQYERRGNAVKVDHDRDGMADEDPYEDLNNDGWITNMRVESPLGDYKLHPTDPRVLVKADRSKGESGNYLLYSEGIDNDKDGKFNEDGTEGIAFNKNFTYQFPVFQPLAGDYPVSQKETRALIDYLFQQWNIFAFVTFSPANNLSTPLKYDEKGAKKRVISSMLEKDVDLNKMLSELYNSTISQNAFLQDNQGTPGDFYQWAYFHFGRLSFSTPGWWVPEVKSDKEKDKNEEEAKQEKKDSKKEEDKDKPVITKESNFLAWAAPHGLNNVFVPWTEVSHPDFPNLKVEVGGIKPFVLHNAPFRQVDSIAIQHTNFIVKLAEIQPKLEFHNVKVEKLGNRLHRITADLFNNSPLPTHSELGEKSRWLRKIRIDITKDKKEVLAGNTLNLIDKLGAFETKKVSWIVQGTGNVVIKAGASHCGIATLNVKL
ncbi:M14 family metallopeptidase [Arenibacter sp. GZD96]|uniref:M14 family metallopeptidase n=1 Tax=Aurantibrevibacter litoralis TaxID=3106030 RepID=UPI002B0012E6|nr:M14 family metallopeptidase [Arenibacter sp. GZD-96]MEA1787454.1 M14 family metallopeptidase [Arenibacter sp. GZD-96]